MLKKSALLIVTLLSVSTALYAASFDSSYSSIAENDCKTIKSDDYGSTQHCKGFANMSVVVTDFDTRQDIIIQQQQKTGGKQDFPLALVQTVSSAFSSLGDKIEWRHKRGKPKELVGMIVRFNVAENPDKPTKNTSYLVVSKVLDDQVCVVGKVSPQKGNVQNKHARAMADKSATMPCLDGRPSSSGASVATSTDSDAAVAVSRATYKCDGKVAFEVVFEVGKVRYLMLKESTVLREVDSASGSRYSDGETTLWLKGDEAMVEIRGVSPYSSCKIFESGEGT
jgi:membrane-bound inhibitor of C-type lysozyme